MEVYDELFEGKLRGKVITDTIYSHHRGDDYIEIDFEDGTSIFIKSRDYFVTINFEGEEGIKTFKDKF